MHSKIATAIALVAAAIWLGGLAVLGAVVAPIVFRNVPLPASADAMVLVFRRFDFLALACAVVIAASEVVRLRGRRERPTRLDATRIAAVAVASVLAMSIAGWFGPAIAKLHAAGAIRGVGEAGARLESTHRLTEWIAKIELLALLVYVSATGAKTTSESSVARSVEPD